ncbi:MAG: glycosyltransferase family 39 protein, partial [Bacteroidota bacterium]
KNNLLKVAMWAIVLFIPFLGAAHLFDWDEINFAESAREMMLTKEYFRVQINFMPFWEKPPLFFWLQTACYYCFGVNEFAARFPNAICGIFVLCTVFHIAKTHFNNRLATLWVLFITASFTPHLYYKSGIIDPWFNYFIFLSIYQLYLAYLNKEQRTKHFLLTGVFNGLAVLTKGPVALLILGLCGFVFWAFQRFKPYFSIINLLAALLLITGITSIWFINELLQNGPSVLREFIAYQVDLFVNPVAGHGQPFWYHPVVIFFGCFPASIFALKGFTLRRNDLNNNQNQFKLLMNIMFWVVLILFSIVKTKIVHYSSLCYLPLTFLSAWYMDDVLTRNKTIPLFKGMMLLLIGLILSAAFSALPFIDQIKANIIPLIKDDFAVASLSVTGDWNGFEWIIGSLFGIITIVFFIQQRRKNTMAALYTFLVAFSLLIPLYIWQMAPKIEQYSQAPAIEFYKALQGRDCYVETFGFKSYAQYFYARQQNHNNPKSADREWLFKGDTDKPVYIVAKITSEDECRSYPFIEISRKGGFIFYRKID